VTDDLFSMDHLLNPDQMAVREGVRKVCADFDDDYWRERDNAREYPEDFMQAMAATGWQGILMPEEVGGAGLSHLEFALVERELGRGSMALTHFFGRPQNILMACKGDQRDRYLLPAVRGERMDALAMTEPDAGSDVRGMKCAARRDGGDWVINGTKHFISHADIAPRIPVDHRRPACSTRVSFAREGIQEGICRRVVDLPRKTEEGRHGRKQDEQVQVFGDGLIEMQGAGHFRGKQAPHRRWVFHH